MPHKWAHTVYGRYMINSVQKVDKGNADSRKGDRIYDVSTWRILIHKFRWSLRFWKRLGHIRATNPTIFIMADVFELELHDLQEDDPNRAPDSDDDIIEVDEVISWICSFFGLCKCFLVQWSVLNGSGHVTGASFWFQFAI